MRKALLLVYLFLLPLSVLAAEPFTIQKSIFQVESALNEWSYKSATAFAITSDLVIVNQHVLREMPLGYMLYLVINENSGQAKKVSGLPVLCTSYYDFCVIRFTQSVNFEPVTFSRKQPAQNETLKLFGYAIDLGVEETTGQIAKHSSQENLLHCIPEQAGKSGAPIFNSKSEVVGVNVGQFAMDAGCSTRENVGAAIHSHQILDYLENNYPEIYKKLKIAE